jgi:hypothetical protein
VITPVFAVGEHVRVISHAGVSVGATVTEVKTPSGGVVRVAVATSGVTMTFTRRLNGKFVLLGRAARGGTFLRKSAACS